MDYFSQGRPQVPAHQANHHYMNFSQTTPTSYSMNYGQMQPQQQTSPYQQQHYTVPAGPANSGPDYSSQHGQTINSHTHSNSNRTRTARSGMMNAGDSTHQHTAAASVPRYQMPGQDFPVRILVDHKYIGAIIGNKGVHIKEIINETKARITVDPQKVPKDTQGNADKIINITGPLDNAGRAVVKILEIVEAEMKKEEGDDHKEVELRIRAHNQLVGRLIGRLGCSIKKIMQETGTVIIVSNTGDGNSGLSSGMDIINNFPQALVTLERTITVRGPSIESVSAAEQKISAKLRHSFEMDLNNRLQLTSGVSGMPFMSPMSNEQWIMPVNRAPVNANAQVPKIIKLYVPNNMVGAIIGSKGLHIRNIIRNSGALIRIEGSERKDRSEEEHKSDTTASQEFQGTMPIRSDVEEGQGDGPVASHNGERRDDERLVTITGNDFQQCRAQYMIYTRIAEQQQVYLDDVKLRTEVVVPSRLVGRIIGKGGQNVKELQRITGTTVKIPEDEPKVETLDENCREGVEGTIVRIIGNCHGSSSVQYRISCLINEFSRTTIHDRRREDNNDSGLSDSLSHNKPTSPSSSAAE